MALDDDVEKMGKEVSFQEKTELGEVMDNFDKDAPDKESRLSAIDFNTRLDPLAIGSIMIIDELTRLGIGPSDNATLTRVKKRLAVSEGGWGREGKIRLVAGERENRTGQGVMARIGGMFQRREGP